MAHPTGREAPRQKSSRLRDDGSPGQAPSSQAETRKDDDPAACMAVDPATKTGMAGVTLAEAFSDLL
jgi:hypothetical protein